MSSSFSRRGLGVSVGVVSNHSHVPLVGVSPGETIVVVLEGRFQDSEEISPQSHPTTGSAVLRDKQSSDWSMQAIYIYSSRFEERSGCRSLLSEAVSPYFNNVSANNSQSLRKTQAYVGSGSGWVLHLSSSSTDEYVWLAWHFLLPTNALAYLLMNHCFHTAEVRR